MENRKQRVTKNLFVKMVYIAVQLKLHLIIRITLRKCKYLISLIKEKRKGKISSRFALSVLGRTRERRGVDATPIKLIKHSTRRKETMLSGFENWVSVNSGL